MPVLKRKELSRILLEVSKELAELLTPDPGQQCGLAKTQVLLFEVPVLDTQDCAFLLFADEVPIRTWFPKENLFTFQTATTTMQA